MSKYDAIGVFLRRRPDGCAKTELSFGDIEGILGCNLPATARLDRPWWGNARNYLPSRCWLEAGWKVSTVDLSAERVTFVRISESALSPQQFGRYAGLSSFLSDIPEQQVQIALSFHEIEEVIGAGLPRSARQDRTWWANMDSTPWVAAGWVVESVYLRSGTIVLRRSGEMFLKSIPRYVRALMDGRQLIGSVNPLKVLRMMEFCRRVGWFFEATVLYEKGCPVTDGLSPAESAEMDECYGWCKRALTRYKTVAVRR